MLHEKAQILTGFRSLESRLATRGGVDPPKFSQTYVFVRCSNKLHHFPPPENISWLRPC